MVASEPSSFAIPVPPSPAPCRGALAVGVEALRCGRDPIAPALEELGRRAGARRGVWLHSSGDPLATIFEAVGPPRRGELPADLPRRWWREIAVGELRLLGGSELRRDPRARGAGLAEALLLRTEAGRLWLDSTEPLSLDPPREIAELLAFDRLEELVRLRDLEDRREGLARMGERAAGLAHDLRNQLSVALLESRRRPGGGEGSADTLDGALESARRLCEEFLAGKRAPDRSTQPLAELLREELAATASLSGRVGEVAVALRCPPDLRASVDQSLIRRIVRNLVLNALAASHPGGRVRVEVGEADGGGLELAVADDGRGMNSDELEAMLRPGHTRSGTGYGTSSLLDCLTRLAGELEVESEPGAGTRVVVRLATGA